MNDERKREIMEAVFKAMLSQIVTRHVLPTSKGSLTMEIQQLSNESGIPMDELGEFLKDHLGQSAMMVIMREGAAGLVQ